MQDRFKTVVLQCWVKQQASEAVFAEPARLTPDLFDSGSKRGAEIEANLLDLHHHQIGVCCSAQATCKAQPGIQSDSFLSVFVDQCDPYIVSFQDRLETRDTSRIIGLFK